MSVRAVSRRHVTLGIMWFNANLGAKRTAASSARTERKVGRIASVRYAKSVTI